MWKQSRQHRKQLRPHFKLTRAVWSQIANDPDVTLHDTPRLQDLAAVIAFLCTELLLTITQNRI